ncbi:MAG: GNAT family N-acetyltransferase, partial [Bdellovibrionaceae bacterium]|nr:GNAT family N-acetyltransferase [Pseudobdellovibrionaceae bacterium]
KSKSKKVSKKFTRLFKRVTTALTGRFKKKPVHRPLEPLIEPVPKDILLENIGKMKLIYSSQTSKTPIGVYMAQGFQIPDLMLEIGRLREKVFRTVNEGTGKSCDIDEFDSFYHHIVAIDEESKRVLGAYRLGLVDKILKTTGSEGLYTHTLFKYDGLLNSFFNDSIELGRSFVDDEAGRAALRALDSIWKGIGAFLAENPHYRYLIGPVSISNSYSTNSKLLMIYYLNKNFKSELSTHVKPRKPVKLKSSFDKELKKVAEDLKSFTELDEWVKKYDQTVIPSLLKSYGKFKAQYLSFNFDPDFNTIDGLIMVDLLAAPKEEVIKHMGVDSYEKFLEHYRRLS